MELDITPASGLPTGTGTLDEPFVVTGAYTRISVSGPVHVRLADVTIDGTGSGYGLLIDRGATVDVANLAVSGSWAGGVGVSDSSRLRLSGTVTIAGFSKFGVVGSRGCDISFTGACNLTITGNQAGQGIHLFAHSRLTVAPSGVNIAVRDNLIGIQLGLSSLFQHHGSSGRWLSMKFLTRRAVDVRHEYAVHG